MARLDAIASFRRALMADTAQSSNVILSEPEASGLSTRIWRKAWYAGSSAIGPKFFRTVRANAARWKATRRLWRSASRHACGFAEEVGEGEGAEAATRARCRLENTRRGRDPKGMNSHQQSIPNADGMTTWTTAGIRQSRAAALPRRLRRQQRPDPGGRRWKRERDRRVPSTSATVRTFVPEAANIDANPWRRSCRSGSIGWPSPLSKT